MFYCKFMNKRDAKIISDKVVSALIERQKAVCMTNYQIAKTTGFSESTLSYIKDFKQTPQLMTLILMADAIDVSLAEVFREVESNNKEFYE